MSGQLIVTNTYDQFVSKDKHQLINDSAKQVWRTITDGTAVDNLSDTLSKFLLLVYAVILAISSSYCLITCFPT